MNILSETDFRNEGHGELQGSCSRLTLLHVSLNRIRFKDKNRQQFKVLQRPLRV
ncbi:hypothetical protein GHK62_01980 [Sinorhizobium terangae]|uniref:Uncharacterized protein n=1 Tax=Sinorhizobium terangae TaxID=110322 RepID=A0A6N7L8E0_SINTE|nr:hypothetical protein [Sinorhizobium terangae]